MDWMYYLSMINVVKTKKYKKGERPSFLLDAKLRRSLKRAGDDLRAEENKFR